jgi:hypothetical protein
MLCCQGHFYIWHRIQLKCISLCAHLSFGNTLLPFRGFLCVLLLLKQQGRFWFLHNMYLIVLIQSLFYHCTTTHWYFNTMLYTQYVLTQSACLYHTIYIIICSTLSFSLQSELFSNFWLFKATLVHSSQTIKILPYLTFSVPQLTLNYSLTLCIFTACHLPHPAWHFMALLHNQ